MQYLFLTITQKQKDKEGFYFIPTKALGVFLVTGEAFVHLEDSGLDEVHADLAVLVEEVRHRPLNRTLTNLGALAVAEGQDQVVHVVEPEKMFSIGFEIFEEKKIILNIDLHAGRC